MSSENSTTSGNATNGRSLKRMKLVYGDTTVKFAVNPEDYTQSEPNKATITQTKGGAWIDAWGGGIREITIKGTTGVKGTSGTDIDVGYNRWKTLRNLFREVYDAVTDGEEVTELIKFYNYTDNEYFYCYPTQQGIELYRSKSRPHVYQYTINLWVIRKIGEAEKSSGTIGNPNKTSSSSTSDSVTTKNTKSTVSGGPTSYTFSGRNTDSQADITTVTNTKTKTVLNLQEDCYLYMNELEPLIGGKAGKIAPVTGFQCTQGIDMQSTGTVSNVSSFTGADLTDDVKVSEIPALLLSEVRFTSKVSLETYQMYIAMKDYDPDVLSPAYSLVTGDSPKQRVLNAVNNSKTYDSTLYELIRTYMAKSTLSKTDANRIKVIMLESMMIYRELYTLYTEASTTMSTTVTATYIEILISNIRAMIMYFTLKSTDYNQYDHMDISAELRKLEKIMTQVKTDIIDYM